MQAYALALDIVRGCWLAFVAVWLLAAVSTKRTVYRESHSQRLRYWVLFVIACLLLIYGRQLPYPLNLNVIPHAVPIAWTAVILCIAGLLVALWARVILGRNWSGMVTLKEGHELVERGPYRVVRHPIYTGYLISHVAFAAAHPTTWNIGVIVVSDVALVVRALLEERVLIQDERYRVYCARVGWHLMPGVF